ncbi:MAG: hypothetical protein ACAH95_18035 [Fimbriimonas sp.]
MALPALSLGQGFGRFGYSEYPTLPGLSIDKEGFSAKQPAADKLRFITVSKTWKPVSISPTGSTVILDKAAWCPQKIRFDLFAPGVSMYFPMGMRLRVGSTAAPYLTWTEGSVTNGVPTPPSSWLALSFRDNQPAFAFGFPGGPAALDIKGKPGAWVVSTALDFSGWVRLGLPLGTKPNSANSAAALGGLSKVMKEQEALWSSMPPALTKLDVESDLASVQGTWHFDHPGAVIPVGAQFAQLGGYPIKILSESEATQISTEEGPVRIAKGTEISLRFPMRRVPAGRCLALGASLPYPIGTVSPQDINGVAELALESLTGGRDVLTRKAAEDTLAEFLAQSEYTQERWTGQKLPFDSAGNDLDLTAAHALLMQAIATTAKPNSEANSLLTSVSWIQDWSTWLPAVKDADKARRAAALAAIAGTLCPEANRRLTAAMFQAGLAAERGLAIWKRRSGVVKEDAQLLEPLVGLRRGLFGLSWPLVEDTSFASNLLSPIRVFSEGPVRLAKQEQQWAITWTAAEAKPSILTLACAFPVQVEPLKNLVKFDITSVLGLMEIHYTAETAGTCEAELSIPSWAKGPPDAARVPRYSEPKLGPNPR